MHLFCRNISLILTNMQKFFNLIILYYYKFSMVMSHIIILIWKSNNENISFFFYKFGMLLNENKYKPKANCIDCKYNNKYVI
jgi:hypothetical protein